MSKIFLNSWKINLQESCLLARIAVSCKTLQDCRILALTWMLFVHGQCVCCGIFTNPESVLVTWTKRLQEVDVGRHCR